MNPDWWRGAVIYQVYPRSFQDSDGDGVGDLAGLTSRLDYVAALGVDAIWLSPVFTSPMADMGYDVADYRDIDPVFGTLDDFDRLIARAHALGLKVIIDQVINHSSDQHPWFVESRASRDNPRADWYVWADPRPDGTPPNNWQSLFGGPAWTWDAHRRQYYLHNFLSAQPDLNFHNPAVQEAVLDVLRFWLDRGVDGFRLDTVNFYFHDRQLRDNPPRDTGPGTAPWPDLRPFDMQYSLYQKSRPENLAFLQRIRALMDEYDDRTLVGEVGEMHEAIALMGSYTSGGRLHMAYAFEMLGDRLSPAHVRACIEGFFAGAPQGWPCWAFSNHDVHRHVTRWVALGADSDSLARLCAALLVSLQGSLCLYQGEELGQVQARLDRDELVDPQGIAFWPEDFGRDGCRTPMVWDHAASQGGFTTGRPWLPVKPAQLAHAADLQTSPDSVLATYRALLALRRDSADLRLGATTFLEVPEPVLAFRRGAGTLCVFNLSPDPQQVTLAGLGRVLARQAAEVAGQTLALGPSGYLIAAPA
ncbi:MAG: DUF3459 domain-containing protein [Limimaricola sp.]|uniref:alpha-glucosidase n=1 Tax=Limimaricola sp. TaxID=2211665 RepID=UPI001D2354C5|nr:alpha-glucosidase [Limimaricola sp.]MBI1416391.1 DUF3459 domain-containing protein [Limimaricola sp.]